MVSRVGSFAFEPVGIDAPKNVSPYELRALVATGLRGRTYLAYTASGQAVAVKVFRFGVGSDPKARARFLRAVTVARSMHCEFVAPVRGAGFTMHKLWQATEYQPGPSLADAVFRYGALPREGVRRLALALTEVVGELHLVGLSGRGLIPADVVLTAAGPRVVDLGFARVEIEGGGGEGTTSMASGGELPGRYTSGAAVLAQDVWHVAAILYFAATGRVETTDCAEILGAGIGNCPEPLRELIVASLRPNPALRPRLAELAAAASRAGVPGTPMQWDSGDWLPKGALRDAEERATLVDSIHRQHAWVTGGELPRPPAAARPAPEGDPSAGAAEEPKPGGKQRSAADIANSLARRARRRLPGV